MQNTYCSCQKEVYPTFGKYYVRLRDLFKGGGLSLEQFSFILKATGAVISGSTILDAIQDKGLTDPQSDLDIFVEEKNVALLNALIYPLFVKYENPPNPHIRDHTGPGYMTNIVGLYNYTWYSSKDKLYKPVQIIVIKNGITPLEHIQRFDLTFCQNYFDGDRFYSFHPQCVKNKTGSCGVTIDYDRLGRINKYIERGYTITNFNKDALDKEEATRADLIKKYRNPLCKIDFYRKLNEIQCNKIDYYTQLKLLNLEATNYINNEYLKVVTINT